MIGTRNKIDGHGSLKLENQSQKYVRERRNYIMSKSLCIVLEEIFGPTYLSCIEDNWGMILLHHKMPVVHKPYLTHVNKEF